MERQRGAAGRNANRFPACAERFAPECERVQESNCLLNVPNNAQYDLYCPLLGITNHAVENDRLRQE